MIENNEYRGEMKRSLSMAEWCKLSSRHQHTIYADPPYVNTAARDFRIDPKSPNRGAGTDGVTIGVLAE